MRIRTDSVLRSLARIQKDLDRLLESAEAIDSYSDQIIIQTAISYCFKAQQALRGKGQVV